MSAALLRLFRGVLVENKRRKKISPEVMERTLRNGFVLDPVIRPSDSLLDDIDSVVGLSGEKMNASFHKSWKVVQDSSDLSLFVQQMLHYMTTYGFEDAGIYSADTVYIPKEALEIPELHSVPLTVIHGMKRDEVFDSLVELGSGVALAEDTLDDILSVVGEFEFDASLADKVNNRELKSLLYDFFGICPKEPVAYLRYVVTRLTDESLLIKNKELLEKLGSANGKFLDELLKSAPDDLASIFFRFKPIFLALKSISRNKTFFNRLRKKADKMHKPLPEDCLNSVTGRIKTGTLDMKRLGDKLSSTTLFRKVRLANALRFRLDDPGSVVYRVRNGRGWATDFSWDESLVKPTAETLDLVLGSIAEGLRPSVEGKVIYIPEGVSYALPATEKQFTGNFPTGSYISVPEDLVVGIHWTNVDGHRIDLDLSLLNASGKVGWDGSYRTHSRDVLFSGDVTDAPSPNGASELFYLKRGVESPWVLSVNYYNYQEDTPVPCKIIVAQEKAKKFGSNYTVDPNNVIASADVLVSRKQTSLGLLTNVDGENRFYMTNVGIGNSISASSGEWANHTREHFVSSLVNAVGLSECLVRAGAEVVGDKPDVDFIDLSPEVLDKRSILGLISSGSPVAV